MLAFLEAFSQVPSVSRAADAAEISRSTVYRLRDRDERFRLAMYEAREKALDLLEQTIFTQATSGLTQRKTVTKTDAEGKVVEVTETEEVVRNPTLAMFYLKRWRPEYRESFRIEQSGPGGGPMRHEVTLVDEVSERARGELERLHAGG